MKRTEKKWEVRNKIPPDVDKALAEYPAGFRQLLYNRTIFTPSDADSFLTKEGPLHDPFLLGGMEQAVDRILFAIQNQEPIVVYGDYDVDGVSATALMVQFLQSAGADVTSYIPDRFDEGYGLNSQAVHDLVEDGKKLMITVDCGIRSIEEIEIAQSLGMDVILSDHHYPGGALPPALAVINPKKTNDPYPYRDLAGVGVAYKIAQAVAQRCTFKPLDADAYLDLVALGTVADIVPLHGENRALVKAGIKKMMQAERPGLSSLAGATGINISKINSRQIGFMLAPRLNAAGRLKSARTAYELLVAADLSKASPLAQTLDDLNKSRQDKVRTLIELAKNEFPQDEPENILITFDKEYHQGVVGLVASRLTEEYYRPSVVGEIKGDLAVASCRSISEFHITQALDQCADLFERHGGHEMAAGFSIKTERIPELKERLTDIASEKLNGKDLRPTLYADIEIDLKQLPANILERIKEIEPTGQTNPEVVIKSPHVQVIFKRKVGDGTHLSLKLRDGMKTYSAIAFRRGDLCEELPEYIDILYTPTLNEFNGSSFTQLQIIDIHYENQEAVQKEA